MLDLACDCNGFWNRFEKQLAITTYGIIRSLSHILTLPSVTQLAAPPYNFK